MVFSLNGDLPNESYNPRRTAEASVEETRTHYTVRHDDRLEFLLRDVERETFHVEIGRCVIRQLLHLDFERICRTGTRCKGRRDGCILRAWDLVHLLLDYGEHSRLNSRRDETYLGERWMKVTIFAQRFDTSFRRIEGLESSRLIINASRQYGWKDVQNKAVAPGCLDRSSAK